MIDAGSLELAHARILARHGERLTAVDWRRIESMRDWAPALELARATALRGWLEGISVDSGVAQIEGTLRRHWRNVVAEVAAWMPVSWQAAVRWCAWLPDLPLVQHVARGGQPPLWIRDDDVWRALAEASPGSRGAVLATGPAAALADAWTVPHDAGRAWLSEWRKRLPGKVSDARANTRATPDSAGGSLEAVVGALQDHAKVFRVAARSQGWALRGALRMELVHLLRRSALQPAMAFIHLALCALDLERLRAELLRRVIFPGWKVA
ncbi:MAG TPA: hypothetical protein VGH48_10350 [Caldimonas sp.]